MIKSSQNITIDTELFSAIGNLSAEIIAHPINNEIVKTVEQRLGETDRGMMTLAPELKSINEKIESVIKQMTKDDYLEFGTEKINWTTYLVPLAVVITVVLLLLGCFVARKWKARKNGHSKQKVRVELAGKKFTKPLNEQVIEAEYVEI